MTQQRRELIDEIFTAALDVAPSQRSTFVAQACRENPELQPLVEALLLEDKYAGSFLEKPLLQLGDRSGSASRESALAFQSNDSPRPESSQSRFTPGVVLSDRFLVVRFIAHGGMGEVYEVEDTFLQGTHVALKTILPHAATDPAMQRRFEHEVLLARKVTHANLCPIYDIFHCKEPPPAFSFLTMKLLSGETLASRLKRSDGLPPNEAMTICGQLISGLAAIHAAGIIHRDIKPNNVIIDDLGSNLHIWITDFGLARLHESEMSVDSAGLIAGTPGYLAPELLVGQSPSQASDIYALGVLIHEIFTGEKPKSFGDVAARLKAKGVRAEFAQLATDFLSEDPRCRCDAFVHAQHIFDPKGSNRTIFTRAGYWQRLGIISIVVLFVVLAATMLWRRFGPHSVPPRVSVIVTEFENRTQDGAFDQTPRELISAALGQSPQVSIFPPSQLPDVLRRMQLPDTSVITEHLGTEICTRQGLQSVISGSISKLGNTYVILVRNLNCNGDPIGGSTEKTFSGPEQLPATIDEIAARIRHKWGESKAAIHQAQPLALVTSSSLEAVKLYSSGKQQLYLGNAARAADLFKRAVELDDNFAMAHEYLAIAYGHLADDEDRAAKEFARAVQLSSRVTEKEREKILGDSALFQYDTAKAMPHLQLLATLSPDDPAVHVNLAECYRDDSRFDRAISEAKKAVQLSGSASPKTNLATYYFLNGDTEQAISQAQEVLKDNPESFKALNVLGNAYIALGKGDQADATWEKMVSLGGSGASMARASMADAARARDNLREAATQLELAIDADSETGNTYGMSKEKIYLADVYRARGDQRALSKSLSELPEPSSPELIYFLGAVYARSGNIVGVERELRRLESMADKTPRVSSSINLLQSEMAIAQNHPQDAVRDATLAVDRYNSPVAIETLARAYEAADSREEAAHQYEMLLARSNERQFDSADSPALYAVAAARYRLGVLDQSLNRKDLAAKQFSSFLNYAAGDQHSGPMYQDVRKRLNQLRSKPLPLANQHQSDTASTP